MVLLLGLVLLLFGGYVKFPAGLETKRCEKLGAGDGEGIHGTKSLNWDVRTENGAELLLGR